MGLNLSARAQQWLKAQDLGIIERLIELAANPDSFVSFRVAQALGISHPKITKKTRGVSPTVSDEQLIELRSKNLKPVAIAKQLGLSPFQVRKRLKQLKEKTTKS